LGGAKEVKKAMAIGVGFKVQVKRRNQEELILKSDILIILKICIFLYFII